MDLEHTKLGRHCEFDSCNQRDFLPFKCDACGQILCLVHRTYSAHRCVGSGHKDMTSIECPICSKSVKFTMAEDADTVWNDHYMKDCAGEGKTAEKRLLKCFKVGCQQNLGPSNHITCAKCKQVVCLQHRDPEEHNCRGFRRQIPPASITSKSKTDKPPQVTKTRVEAPAPQRPHASAMAKPSTNSSTVKSTPEDENSCPFCATSFPDPFSLVSHVDSSHAEGGGPRPPPTQTVPVPTRTHVGRERGQGQGQSGDQGGEVSHVQLRYCQ